MRNGTWLGCPGGFWATSEAITIPGVTDPRIFRLTRCVTTFKVSSPSPLLPPKAIKYSWFFPLSPSHSRIFQPLPLCGPVPAFPIGWLVIFSGFKAAKLSLKALRGPWISGVALFYWDECCRMVAKLEGEAGQRWKLENGEPVR